MTDDEKTALVREAAELLGRLKDAYDVLEDGMRHVSNIARHLSVYKGCDEFLALNLKAMSRLAGINHEAAKKLLDGDKSTIEALYLKMQDELGAIRRMLGKAFEDFDPKDFV